MRQNFALMLFYIIECAGVYKTYNIDLGLDSENNYTDAYCFF